MAHGSHSPPVAVKVLQPAFASDEVWKRRFQRETRILANIDHPNVVRIRATVTLDDGSLAIVQDFIEGAVDLTAKFTSASEAEKVSLVLQALYGLRATHGITPTSGAIHRDVSPSNLLIDPTGQLRIIDFGLSRNEPRQSLVLTVGPSFGTPGCIAPEQLKDPSAADHRSDLFALGRSIAAAIQNRHPQHADCAALPEPWRTICLRLTEHDPDGRYPDASEAANGIIDRFYAAGVVPADTDLHPREFQNWKAPPAAWPTVLSHIIRNHSGPTYLLYALARLIGDETVACLDVNSLFPILDTSAFDPVFGKGRASFSSTDNLGDLIIRWLPHLDAARKEIAFRRLVKTAVEYNRFHLMDLVRSAYAQQQDDAVKRAFRAILGEDDPNDVIRGVTHDR